MPFTTGESLCNTARMLCEDGRCTDDQYRTFCREKNWLVKGPFISKGVKPEEFETWYDWFLWMCELSETVGGNETDQSYAISQMLQAGKPKGLGDWKDWIRRVRDGIRSVSTAPLSKAQSPVENAGVLLGNYAFMLAVVEHFDKNALYHADAELKKNEKLVLAAVKRDGYALEFADAELKRDKKIVLAAVQQNGLALQWADPVMKLDRHVVMAAVKNEISALTYADPVMKGDRDVVMAAITAFPWGFHALKWAAPALKRDRNFMLDAVVHNGLALQFADPTLKSDKVFVMVAVQQNSKALEFADPTLFSDTDVVLAATKQNADAIKYLAD